MPTPIEQIASLKAENEQLKQERDTARAEKDSAVTAATEPLQTKISTLTAERDGYKTQLEAANTSIAAKDNEIAKLKANDKTSGQKAVEIAASQTTPAVGGQSASAASEPTADELVAQVQAETDPKKRAALYAKLSAKWSK